VVFVTNVKKIDVAVQKGSFLCLGDLNVTSAGDGVPSLAIKNNYYDLAFVRIMTSPSKETTAGHRTHSVYSLKSVYMFNCTLKRLFLSQCHLFALI
jgi:hypothetical protein